MINTPTYRIELRLNGTLIGDVREIAEKLTWRKARTAYGTDEIDFTLNDKLFADWCQKRNTTISQMLKPYALDARIIRNGEAILGGYLATMPAYQPQNDSADLQLRFDGYLNLLQGVYIRPTATQTANLDTIIRGWITDAETRATNAGKAFGITYQPSDTLASVQMTFDNYKSVKEAIVDRADNIEGAGQFDLIFNPDRSYYIAKNLGREITAWNLYYPAHLGGQGIATISAEEVQGFASHIITLGAGETSSDPNKSTVIVSESTDSTAVAEYGYVENLTQYSSISVQATLDQKCATDLASAANAKWEPRITLIGRQTPPSPTADYGLWIGDRINIINTADPTGQTSGRFRINILDVSVSGTNAETIRPTLERLI